MSQNPLSLKVLEAYTRDVGRGVARIDYDSMDNLGASTGDVIEIKGKRRTVAKCLPLYPSDEGKGIIRIDGLGRNNSGMQSVMQYLSKSCPGCIQFTHIDNLYSIRDAQYLVPKSEVSLQEKLAEPV